MLLFSCVSASGESDSVAASPRKPSLPPTNGTMSGKLVMVVLLLSAAVVVMAISMLVLTRSRLNQENKSNANLCETEECIISAARIINSLDTRVNPCDDFYQFACGGWIEKNPLPEEYSEWDQFSDLRLKLLYTIRDILTEEDTAMTPKPLKQARSLYKSCLDEDALEELGVTPMLKLLKSVGLPNVPIDLQIAREQNDSVPAPWINVITKTTRFLGGSILFNLYVSESPRNTSKNILALDQASVGFSERYLRDPERFSKEIKLYEEYISDMITYFVEQVPGATVNGSLVAQEIIEFSTKLANAITPDEERRDMNSLAKDFTLQGVQNISDYKWDFKKGTANRLEWSKYLKDVYKGLNVTLDYDNITLTVLDTKYLQNLAELLQNTSPETIERYLWWRVFSPFASLTMKQFRDINSRLGQKLMGNTASSPRWRSCASTANSNFGMAISYEYVKRAFNEESRQKALEMVKDIHTAFKDMVRDLDWMDAATKNRTLEKADAIRPYVGFPDWLLTPGQLEKYYQGTEIFDGRLFASYMSIISNNARLALQEIAKVPNRNKFIASPTTVNAFYHPVLNSITFPAGILHPPFYGLGMEALNYGAIGAIIGHEITHGFDDQGRQYDLNGNLKQWWTNKTLTEYNRRVQCIIDQYGSYQVRPLGDNFTLNGINTQGENIADNGGMREALRAYGYLTERLIRSNNGNEIQPTLPGLSKYTQKQLFFLGFAHMWCGSSTLGALKSAVVDDAHSPDRYRVIGTLSNMREFAEAWQCPAGSPMNPHKKCVLW